MNVRVLFYQHLSTFQLSRTAHFLLFWLSSGTKDRPRRKPRGKSGFVYDVLLYCGGVGYIRGWPQPDYWSSVDARKLTNGFYWGLDSLKKGLRFRCFLVAQILKWIFASKSTPVYQLCDLANKPLDLILFSNIVLFAFRRHEALSIKSSQREGELQVRSKQWYQTYAENGTDYRHDR